MVLKQLVRDSDSTLDHYRELRALVKGLAVQSESVAVVDRCGCRLLSTNLRGL